MMGERKGQTPTFASVKEVRERFYPRMSRLLDLDPDELVGFPEIPGDAKHVDDEEDE